MVKPPLIAILGPTAVGKTEIAIQVAAKLGAEIVSADSRLLYRGMDIGTAKPTPTQQARVPHHLIDVADPGESWSLATYRRAALEAIADIQQRGRLPLLVGGSGQYLTALLEGWQPPPRPRDDGLRRELQDYAERHGPEALHRRLARIDPVRAAELDPRNVRRVVRAMEISQLTGMPPSQIQVRHPSPFRSLKIGLSLPRAELYRRIDARIEGMLANGLLEEVRALLERGLRPEDPPLSAIGYRQIAAHLQGEITLDEAVAAIRKQTRQFVRRQANWFRQDDPSIAWFEVEEGMLPRLLERIERWLEDGS